jgi:hypothetical protein
MFDGAGRRQPSARRRGERRSWRAGRCSSPSGRTASQRRRPSSSHRSGCSRYLNDKYSVADPGCLSRIPDPDFYPFRIPDQTATKDRGEKKLVVKPFFVATISQKCKLFYFLNAEEKNLGQFSKNYRTFSKNLSLSSKKYGVGIRDPERNLFWIPDPGPGVKKAPDPGSGSATLDKYSKVPVEIPVFLALQSRVPDPNRIHSYWIQVLKLHSYLAKKECGIRVHSIPVFKNIVVLLTDGSLFATLF